jgi:hypothetical protein
MSLAFLDDDRDRSAEFLVSLLDGSRLIGERRVERAANVQERYTAFASGARFSSSGAFDMKLRSTGFSA